MHSILCQMHSRRQVVDLQTFQVTSKVHAGRPVHRKSGYKLPMVLEDWQKKTKTKTVAGDTQRIYPDCQVSPHADSAGSVGKAEPKERPASLTRYDSHSPVAP